MCAEKNYRTVKEACAGRSFKEGGINVSKLWKLKKKLRCIVAKPPTSMLDAKEYLFTSASAIEKLLIEMYQEGLSAFKIKDNLQVHEMYIDNLCEKILEEKHEKKKKLLWTMGDLEDVLKRLKNQKSKNPIGLTHDLF